MSDPTKPSREAAWLTKQAMADVLDVTVGYFDREIRRYAKPEHIRREGKRLMFYARGVLDSWYSARLRATPVDPQLSAEIDFLILEAQMASLDPTVISTNQ